MNEVGQLSAAAEAKLKEIIARYPKAKSAVLPALYLAQEELGSITDHAIEWVSERLQLAPAHVREVATFYTMFHKRPVGRYHLQLCRTLSCALCGEASLLQYLKERLGVAADCVTSDGLWSYEEVECLGSCGSGPVVQINDVFFERMNPQRLGALLDRLAREQPDLHFSTIREELGNGLPDHPRSAVLDPASPSESVAARQGEDQ